MATGIPSLTGSPGTGVETCYFLAGVSWKVGCMTRWRIVAFTLHATSHEQQK